MLDANPVRFIPHVHVWACSVRARRQASEDPDAQLGWNIYEYLAGSLYGGFEYPKSVGSAVFQVFIGFFMLVTISAYTANLAAFLTVSAGGTISVSSLTAAMDNSGSSPPTVCSYPNPLLDQFGSLYPTLQYDMHASRAIMGEHLVHINGNRGCDAAIVPKITYDIYRTDPRYCTMRPVGAHPSSHRASPTLLVVTCLSTPRLLLVALATF